MNIEIDTKEEVIEVELTFETSKVNDSIGNYDYSGFQYYDSQEDRIVVDKFEWDESLYSENQNKIISKYVYNNFPELQEKAIEKL